SFRLTIWILGSAGGCCGHLFCDLRIVWLCHCPAAQHFGNAPSLGDTAPRRVWLLGVVDFTDRSQARVCEMSRESRKKRARLFEFIWMDFQPGIEKWPDQPGPDCPLVIGGIACFEVAMVILFVIRVVR